MPLIYAAVILLVLALLFLWNAARQRRASGLPEGRVIYSDTGGWGRVEKPLYDPVTGLTGKPDYLVEQNGRWIPVEVKSGYAPSAPREGHVFQLAAYCLLVEHSTGKRPPYGILRYRNRTYAIDYTPTLEADLRELLGEMRLEERRGESARSHDEPARCARCGFRGVCDQRL